MNTSRLFAALLLGVFFTINGMDSLDLMNLEVEKNECSTGRALYEGAVVFTETIKDCGYKKLHPLENPSSMPFHISEESQLTKFGNKEISRTDYATVSNIVKAARPNSVYPILIMNEETQERNASQAAISTRHGVWINPNVYYSLSPTQQQHVIAEQLSISHDRNFFLTKAKIGAQVAGITAGLWWTNKFLKRQHANTPSGDFKNFMKTLIVAGTCAQVAHNFLTRGALTDKEFKGEDRPPLSSAEQDYIAHQASLLVKNAQQPH